MQDWAYVFLCLLLPVVWGIVSAFVFDWIAARRDAARAARYGVLTSRENEDMYYI